MKPRRWVIVVFVSILIAAGALFEGVRHVEKGRHLERLLTRQLSEASGGDVTVGRVVLGFFSVYLQNVNASLSLHTYSLNIRDIKISFSLIKLFRTRGDFAKSISKIILLSPALEFKVHPGPPPQPFQPQQAGVPAALQTQPPIQSARLFDAFRTLPVDYLLVRKGTVTFSTGAAQQQILLGEDLSGRLWEDLAGVTLELRGKMASRKKNMALSAVFSRTGRDHRVSLRLDKAEINRPVRLVGAQIVSGVLDGVIELSFPDSLTAETFEANGWVRILGGSCLVNGVDSLVSPIGLYTTLSNTVLRVDSLRCGYRGMDFTGRGDWDFAPSPRNETGLLMRCAGIRPDRLSFLPAGALENITGSGWVETKIVRQKRDGHRRFSFQAGGLNVGGQQITMVSGAGAWDASQVTADSFSATGPGFSAKGSGIVNYEKPPVAYTVSLACRIDSVKGLHELRGQFGLNGTVRGLGPEYFCDAVLSSRSLAWDSIPLGAPEIHISLSRNKPLLFSSSNTNARFVTVTGAIDSLGTPHPPSITGTAAAGTGTVRSLLERLMPPSSAGGFGGRIDSAWAKAAFRGTGAAFSINGAVGASIGSIAAADGHGIRGAVGLQIDKKENSRALQWQVYPQGLTVAGTAVPLRGGGSLAGDSLIVDSLSVVPGLRVSGLVRFGPVPDVLASVYFRDVSVSQIAALAPGVGLPLTAGTVSGTTRLLGPLAHVRTDSDLRVRGLTLGYLTNLETDIVCSTRDTLFTLMPATIRQAGRTLIVMDTISNRNGLSFSGRFQHVEVFSLIKDALPEDYNRDDHVISGEVSGTISAVGTAASAGPAAAVSLRSDHVGMDSWRLDSIAANLVIDGRGITLKSLTASDSARARVKAGGFVPWTALSDEPPEEDTLTLWASVSGDLVALVEHNAAIPFHLPIAGHGLGTIDVAVRGVAGNFSVTKALMQVPHGVLRVKPYVPEDIKDFSMRVTMENINPDNEGGDGDDNARISLVMSGTIGRRPVTIHSTHAIPPGFEPITVGFLDIGALLITTPKHGIDIHVPGFTEVGAVSDVEFAAKAPWPEFALSGPLDKLCISGTWVLRTCDITFPMLDNAETHVIFDPFPYITWNFDMKTGNRKVKYYYDTGKNRNLMRLVEVYFDPVSVLALRGRYLDNTFKLEKGFRFSTGSVFFGRTFDRNVDIGLDFVPQPLPGGHGYDNIPIIWGSAEAVSDTSRFDHIKLTLLTRDSVTGAWMERGRFYDIHFRVGSNIEDFPGQTQQKFVAAEQKRYGSLSGAGTFASTVGEQYLHRLLFQNMERRLAKGLGLDVITIETSIASNYFNKLYNRQFELNRWDYLALANVGITMGRYILNDKVFLKWRTELVPIDTALQPQYNFGFEFQPLQYFLMDINYGIHVGDKTLEYNPQLNLELRLPIKDIRKYFDF
jgi:hypothetical protein